MRRLVVLLLVLPVLAAGACAHPKATATTPAVAELVAGYDRETTPYYPFSASEAGLRQYDRVFANDIGEVYRNGMQEICGRYRRELRRVDAAALAAPERLSHDIFAHRLDTCLESARFPWYLLPVNQAGSWPTRFPIIGAGRGVHPFKTVQNYEDFLGRIDGFVVWMDTAVANMRVGIARGITQPRDAMLRLVPQLDAQIVDDPRTSLFYEPIKNAPPAFDDAARRTLEAKYVEAIGARIVPAYRRLRAFVQDEYLAHCRASFGIGGLPDGKAWYAYAARTSTTTSLTPDEIYDLGIAEVARIRAEIDALRAEITAHGDPELTRYQDPDELLRGYGALRGSVDAALPTLFGRLPRAGYQIRAIEPFRERSMPSSYEAPSLDGTRPGVFYLNVSNVRNGGSGTVSRSLFLHEAVPGHHFQVSLQRENASLPGFRRFGWYTAFGEGWALYAERLGVELGVYQNRRDRLGMLFDELFRAARLVVDVGLHDRGWTKERAIAYLPSPRDNAVREVERYMVWPGQALGYKIGQLKFLALRRRAETALGPAFDVRAFHDELLRDGGMPLSILEGKMDAWIAAQRGTRS